MFPKKHFFHLNLDACPSGHAQDQSACPPLKWKKCFIGNILSVKIHFVKSQGIYLESGLVSSFNGWTSQKMHEILLCLKFEAFVDVIWKSFLACLMTWMLDFFQIKYFDVVTHDHLILELYTSLVNVRVPEQQIVLLCLEEEERWDMQYGSHSAHRRTPCDAVSNFPTSAY